MEHLIDETYYWKSYTLGHTQILENKIEQNVCIKMEQPKMNLRETKLCSLFTFFRDGKEINNCTLTPKTYI